RCRKRKAKQIANIAVFERGYVVSNEQHFSKYRGTIEWCSRLESFWRLAFRRVVTRYLLVKVIPEISDSLPKRSHVDMVDTCLYLPCQRCVWVNLNTNCVMTGKHCLD